jgi:hypothetical protein
VIRRDPVWPENWIRMNFHAIFSAGPVLAIMTSEMTRVLDSFRFVLIAVAGWMNQSQLQVIDYLREENRVLREQLGGRRLRLNDDQRRRLAAKAKGLGEALGRSGHDRYPRDVAGLASQTDCPEIRR